MGFIRVPDVDKDKPIEDQLKVIREDVLYTSNEVYQVLQVVERFNQRLFDIEARLKAIEKGLKEVKKDAAAKAQLSLVSQYRRREEVKDQK